MGKDLPDNIDISGAVAILEITRHMGTLSDLDELLGLIIRETTAVLNCDRASLFLYDADNLELYSKIAHGVGREIRLPVDRGIVGACAIGREVINVVDAYADGRFNPDVDTATGYRTRNILTCPLISYDNDLVGVVQAINKHQGGFERNDEWLLETLSSQAAVALQRAKLLQAYAKKQKLDHELNLAREIQQGLLPKESPTVPGYQIVGWNCPADQTGGDGYDFIETHDGQLAVVLADASGHGIAPALVVAQLQAMLRVLFLTDDHEHCKVIGSVNNLLCDDLPADRFVTAFCGRLNGSGHELSYCSAGQGPILHIRAGQGRVERFNATHCPLGIVPGLEFGLAPSIHFEPGDVVLLVTDGFFEWANTADEQFGIDRLAELALKLAGRDADQILTGIREEVIAFSGGTEQADDLTAVVIKRG